MKNIFAIITVIFACFSTLSSQWINCNNGLRGGIINSLTTNNNILYATINRGGLHVSTDFGITWIKNNNGIRDSILYALAVDNDFIITGGTRSCYLSSDNGNSWIEKSIFTGNNYPRVFVIDGENIYAASYYGIYISTDKGVTWNARNNGLTNLQIRSLRVKSDIIYAGTDIGTVYLSTNKGLNWHLIYTADANENVFFINFVDDDIYIGLDGSGVFVSSDKGTNWTSRNNWLTELHVRDMVVDDNGNLYVATINGIFASTDKGEIWTKKGIEQMNEGITKLSVIGNKLFAGLNGKGIRFSDDCAESWYEINEGLPANPVLSFANIDNDIFIATWGRGICTSRDIGENWTEINDGLVMLYYYDSDIETMDGKLFKSGYNRMFFFNELGKKWDMLPLPPKTSKIVGMKSLGNNLVAATNGGVFTSEYFGTSWTEKNNGIEDLSVATLSVNGNDIYVGFSNASLYVSNDMGESWKELCIADNTSIRYKAIVKDDKLYAYSRYGYQFSTDNGITWEKHENDLSTADIYVMYASRTLLFAGVYGDGVFFSADDGLTWQEKNIGLSNREVLSLKVIENYLFAGTNTGVYKIALDSFSGVDNDNNSNIHIPDDYFLISPNPANDRIVLSFACKDLLPEEISIYNALGIEIIRKGNTNLLENQTMNISTSELSSGVYYCVVNYKNKILAKSFVIMRR